MSGCEAANFPPAVHIDAKNTKKHSINEQCFTKITPKHVLFADMLAA